MTHSHGRRFFVSFIPQQVQQHFLLPPFLPQQLGFFHLLNYKFYFYFITVPHYLQRRTSCLFCRKSVAGWIHLFVFASRFLLHWCWFINIYWKMWGTKNYFLCLSSSLKNCFGTLITPPVQFSSVIMSLWLIIKVLITSVEHKSRVQPPVGVASAGRWWRRRRKRTRPSRRMCSQGSVIALLANLPCSPAAYHHLERMPSLTGLAAELDSRASERCQAQEENPGGKWPFFRAPRPHSAALAVRLQCWRRLPFLSTRQHPLHLASQTNPHRRSPHRRLFQDCVISHKPHGGITWRCLIQGQPLRCGDSPSGPNLSIISGD